MKKLDKSYKYINLPKRLIYLFQVNIIVKHIHEKSDLSGKTNQFIDP